MSEKKNFIHSEDEIHINSLRQVVLERNFSQTESSETNEPIDSHYLAA